MEEIRSDEIRSDEIRSDEIRWFRSNASGVALEAVPSRLAALRGEYCLSAGKAEARQLPEILAPYYDDSFVIESRVLYEKGVELRRQWIFRDGNGTARLASSGSGDFFKAGSSGGEAGTGFIEIRNGEGSLEKEIRFEDDLSEWEFRFFYAENILLSSETWFKKSGAGESAYVQVNTDRYRYSRSGSLRAVDRVLHEGAGLSRVSFPPIGPASGAGGEIVTPETAYSSGFLPPVYGEDGITISYTLDSRGRILTEVRKDSDGEVVSEYRNTWDGGKLKSVLWKSAGDERLIEYEYDGGGNRVVERNFRQGILERSITSRDGKEVEEIYMNGKLILRALWEQGLKISEERISPGKTSGRTSAGGTR